MGKRLEAAAKAYDKKKVYTVEEGVKIVKDNAKAKFDEKVAKLKPVARNVAIACGVALAINAILEAKKDGDK